MRAVRRLPFHRLYATPPPTLLVSGHFLRALAVALFLIALFQAVTLFQATDAPSPALGDAFQDISGRLWLSSLSGGAFHSGVLWAFGEVLLFLGSPGAAGPG